MKKLIDLIDGGLSVDDRGELVYFNDFNLEKIKRFYIVSNHNINFVRAWHGHKNENKWIYLIDGSALILKIKIDNWENPSKDLFYEKFLLSYKIPKILHIPHGHVHGFKTLQYNTKLLIFSDTLLKDSLHDDIRFDAYYWDHWNIKER